MSDLGLKEVQAFSLLDSILNLAPGNAITFAFEFKVRHRLILNHTFKVPKDRGAPISIALLCGLR